MAGKVEKEVITLWPQIAHSHYPQAVILLDFINEKEVVEVMNAEEKNLTGWLLWVSARSFKQVANGLFVTK